MLKTVAVFNFPDDGATASQLRAFADFGSQFTRARTVLCDGMNDGLEIVVEVPDNDDDDSGVDD